MTEADDWREHERMRRRIVHVARTRCDGDCVDAVAVAAAKVLGLDGAAAVISLRASTLTGYCAAATAPWAAAAEAAQLVVGEGPSLAAMSSGNPVQACGAISIGARWPGFAEMAALGPDASVLACPIHSAAGTALGTLTLYIPGESMVRPDATAISAAFADIAATGLINHIPDYIARINEAGSGYDELNVAVGILSVRLHIGPSDASAWLRAEAFSSGRDLLDLARDVVARR